MKTSLILLVFLSLLSCKHSTLPEANNSDCSPLKIATQIDTLTTVALFGIQNATVSGNTLSLTFSYGGGCDPNHTFQLFAEPNHLVDSTVPYYNGRVIFSTNDYCKRLDTKTFCFDLAPLKKEAKSGKIMIEGWKDVIDF
jgi:hypothetical protein